MAAFEPDHIRAPEPLVGKSLDLHGSRPITVRLSPRADGVAAIEGARLRGQAGGRREVLRHARSVEPIATHSAVDDGRDLCGAESERRRDIVEQMRERGCRSACSAQIVTLETRRTKDYNVPITRLRDEWRARAAERREKCSRSSAAIPTTSAIP